MMPLACARRNSDQVGPFDWGRAPVRRAAAT